MALPSPATDVEMMSLVQDAIDDALRAVDGRPGLMGRMIRYHLGMVDAGGTETTRAERERVQGKRMRPRLAMLVAMAFGGQPAATAPIAAAIEMLHNFTLIHDDIQDQSPQRRHRDTVWTMWGDAQAINAGDALFAAAQQAVLQSGWARANPAAAIRLLTGFNTATISIVRGQVMDLDHEGNLAISPDDYLTTIRGKTAAIVRFAAWAGAITAGAEQVADRCGAMGEAIGMGFQIRDDMLGIWAPASQTGKATADDLRRRKISLPILILRENATADERVDLERLYGQDEIHQAGVDRILGLLSRYGVETAVARHVERAHDDALAVLNGLWPADEANEAARSLRALITDLGTRAW